MGLRRIITARRYRKVPIECPGWVDVVGWVVLDDELHSDCPLCHDERLMAQLFEEGATMRFNPRHHHRDAA